MIKCPNCGGTSITTLVYVTAFVEIDANTKEFLDLVDVDTSEAEMSDEDLWLAYSYTQYLHNTCQDPQRRITYWKDVRLMRQEVIRRRFFD
jgi:hypothetical protein